MNLNGFANKLELFKYLKDNKKQLINEKKAIIKQADAVIYNKVSSRDIEVNKANESINVNDVDVINAKLVLNTTNLIDSHLDVHIKGLWKKTLQEQKNLMLFQEHKSNSFEHIITGNVKAYTELYNWKDLGESYAGTTEALIFDVSIPKDRNPFMFEQYAKGYVTNHSVGMRYVKLEMAINSEERYYAEEKDVWDEYINQVANKEKAEENGFFWVVKEAKLIEGSAVPIGSNTATPTLNVEPSNDTQQNKDSREITIEQIDNYLSKKFKRN